VTSAVAVVVVVVPDRAQKPVGQYAGQFALHQASVDRTLVETYVSAWVVVVVVVVPVVVDDAHVQRSEGQKGGLWLQTLSHQVPVTTELPEEHTSVVVVVVVVVVPVPVLVVVPEQSQ